MALKNRIFSKILDFLKKGITPHKLALSVSLGITIGIIPLYGLTSLLVTLVVFCFRLNLTASHIGHYMVYPLQILLIFPFLKLGDLIFNNSLLPHSFDQLFAMLRTDVWGTLHHFWLAYLTATAVWFIVSIPLAIILYKVLFFSFRKLVPARAK
ncbi:MAG: DUF2062 domain-containing protein [Bacteroidales bacterium]|nr:DUF2062 domain-containing protein [Bacteroidales bacterium]